MTRCPASLKQPFAGAEIISVVRCGLLFSLPVLLSLLLSGCAAFRPVSGVPARYLPDELRSCSRENKRMIDPSLLKRRTDPEYRLDSGDVLAVYIEGILGQREQPPINQPVANQSLDQPRPPTLGYPMTVRDDGTLSLPLIAPIMVRGRTIPQIEQELRHQYTVAKRLLQPGLDRILVALHQPRQYRVLVVRQESQNDTFSAINTSTGMLGRTKRGTGHVVSLPAYKNDVLHALVESGGLPGLDAQNVVYVIHSPPPGPGPVPTANALVPGASSFNPARPFVPGNSGGGPAFVPNYPPPQGAMMPPLPTASNGSGPVIRGQSPDSMPGNPMPMSGSLQSGYAGAVPYLAAPQSAMSQLSPLSIPSSGPQGGNGPPLPQPPAGMLPHGVPFNGMMPPASGAEWQTPGHWESFDPTLVAGALESPNVVRIPLRLADDEPLRLTEQDVTLQDGDIIFIGSRDDEVYYTGGLLGGGEFTLPRDRDIDVLEAIAIAESRSSGQQAGRTALNSAVTISPSQAIVLRNLPNGTQVPILVDLYRARTQSTERILIQPGDYILLQYTSLEAAGAFFERHILATALFGVAAAQLNRGGGI